MGPLTFCIGQPHRPEKFTPCIKCVQYRGGYHDACGGYLEYHGDVQYHLDIMINVGDILNTMRGFQDRGGYLEYRGGVQYHGGYHDAHGGVQYRGGIPSFVI